MSDTDNQKTVETMRWIGLAEYDMKIKVVGYQDGEGFLLQGGDNDPFLAHRLGFSRVNGDWMAPSDRIFTLRMIKVAAPLATLDTIPKSDDMLVWRGGSVPAIPKTPNQVQAFENMPDEFRWVDLSTLGLALKYVLADRPKEPFFEIQGGISFKDAERAGFHPANGGRAVRYGLSLDTVRLKEAFPECDIATMSREDIVEDRRTASAVDMKQTAAPSPKS
jgi:hypothetical protein